MNGTEDFITLNDAAKLIPSFNGNGVHIATLRRWAWHGIRGRKLATTKIGGRTFTTRAAIDDFLTNSPSEVRPYPTGKADIRAELDKEFESRVSNTEDKPHGREHS